MHLTVIVSLVLRLEPRDEQSCHVCGGIILGWGSQIPAGYLVLVWEKPGRAPWLLLVLVPAFATKPEVPAQGAAEFGFCSQRWRGGVAGSAQAGTGSLQTQTVMSDEAFKLGVSQSQGLIISGSSPRT